MQESEYDDSYPTCSKTFSTLCVLSDDVTPDEITNLLQIEPTKVFHKGDSHTQGKLQHKTNGWFYSTEKLSSSKDTRRHLDMIIARLDGKVELVKKLQLRGCRIEVSSYWGSSTGQGGPSLMPEQMLKLGTLGLGVWWDIYFTGEEEA